MKDISERLKEIRKSKGITQGALAEMIGVSRGVIQNIEYGNTSPSKIVTQAICNALQINEEWLLYGKEPKSTEILERDKSVKILSEIYNLAKELSSEEQEYILKLIQDFHAFQNKNK